MAEHSGFFEAKVNEETNEYDRVYYASEFARYFALFIGNGVFAATSDQLMVESVSGMQIKVNPGWGFIEGYWYENDDDLLLNVPVNTMAVARTDIVVLRRDEALRDTHIVYLEGESEIRRDGSYFDLLLATINVPVGSASISNANITDKRPDESVCGFVKGLVEVLSTAELFNQFTATFQEWFAQQNEEYETWSEAQKADFEYWFENVKGQLSGDVAATLTERVETLENNLSLTNIKLSSLETNVSEEIEVLKKSVSDGKTLVANAITDKGVETATDATFETMASNISSIETDPLLQAKTVKLSTSAQTIRPDSGYDGLSQVTVPAITGDAATADVLVGKSFNSATAGVGATGGMANYTGVTVDANTVTSDSSYLYVTVPKEGKFNSTSKLRVARSNLSGKVGVLKTYTIANTYRTSVGGATGTNNAYGITKWNLEGAGVTEWEAIRNGTVQAIFTQTNLKGSTSSYVNGTGGLLASQHIDADGIFQCSVYHGGNGNIYADSLTIFILG